MVLDICDPSNAVECLENRLLHPQKLSVLHALQRIKLFIVALNVCVHSQCVDVHAERRADQYYSVHVGLGIGTAG